MSAGCLAHENGYVETTTQSPHDEIPGQPGFTEAGRQAARTSDLSSSTDWSSTENPWTGAPIHLAQLFNPSDTTAWYGEGPKGACMGTTGNFDDFGGFGADYPGLYPGLWSGVAGMYSLPGNGVSGVHESEGAFRENPYAPAEAAGITGEHGPTIILWPSGGRSSTLAEAVLVGADGHGYALRTAGPQTQSPVSHLSSLPSAPTLGDYTSASFVIPVKPLPRQPYRLTARWTGPGGRPIDQVVTFSVTTGVTSRPVTQAPLTKPVLLQRLLSLKLTIRGGRVVALVQGKGKVAQRVLKGRRARLRFLARRCARCHSRKTTRAVKLPRGPLRVRGPKIAHGGRVTVRVVVSGFKAKGITYKSGTRQASLRRR
jgi:hypothetical protein